MHKNLPTVEGVKTRFLCSITADEGTNTTLAGYVKVGGESLPMTAGGENELVAPATPAGDYLYELRAGGSVVMWGNLCARPSAFPPMAEYTDIELSAEINAGTAIQVEAELRSGPRGEKGERGEEGPRGYSAYEIACKGGFAGTEAEWLEAMRQQTATLAVRDVKPLMERAENAATKAGASETQAKEYAANATSKAEEAHGHASTAGESAKNAVDAASTADAARTGAQDAQRDAEMAAENAEQKAKQAEQSATAARNSAGEATQSAASAEASKKVATTAATDAASAATNAAGSATAAAESARAAAESAARLGDAALKSADNTFSGAVAFTGTVNGVAGYMQSNMLADMMKGAKLTRAELLEFVPANTTIWANYPIPVEGDYTGEMTQWKKLKKAFLTLNVRCGWGVKLYNHSALDEVWYYIEGNPAIAIWRVYGQSRKVMFFAPEFKGDLGGIHRNSVCFHTDNNAKRVEELYVHAPQFQRDLSISGWGDYKTAPALRRIVVGENVFSSVSLPFISPNQVLKTAAGFPMATSINLSDNQLNKESALPILNNLKPYDSASMSKVPTLTIGMHTDLQADEEVVAALELAAAAVEDGGKGWQVSVQWNGTATASTFALRPAPKPPVYIKRAQDEQGDYVDASGVRYGVDWGHSVTSPHGEPEALGYELFESVEEALAEWGLEAYVPEERWQTME